MNSIYRNLLFIVLLLLGLGATLLFLTAKRPTRSQTSQITSSQNKVPKRIVGFLPYWQMDALDNLHFDLLSEVMFFGLHIDERGQILKEDSARLGTDAFKKLQKKANKHTTITIALALQDNEKIEAFLKDPNTWQELSDNLLPLIKTYDLSGINLDFEYSGIPAKETVAAYASFVETLSSRLKKENPALLLTVDVTADAVKKSRLYDVEKLGKASDYLILMGYDFYRPASSVAGPPAPLVGKEIYDYDVTTAITDFFPFVPSDKLLLGVPYYGWDFPTVDDSRGSSVEKRPDEQVALSTYKRNKRLLKEGNVTLHFDSDSQTPWMVYRDPDTQGIRQIWFEDEVSLGKKYDLISSKALAGVAIWALGYDGDSVDLWNLLASKFRN